MHLRTYWRIEAKLPDETNWSPLTDAEGIDDEARAHDFLRQVRESSDGQEFRLVRVEERIEREV